MNEQLKIFVSYSHEDVEDKNVLLKYLKLLGQKYPNIITYHDGLIVPGDKWNEQIIKEIKEAKIIILLLSVDFLISDYVNNVELEIAKKKSENNEAQIIPIFIKACELDAFPRLLDYQVLPKAKKPVESFKIKSEAWNEIYIGLRLAVEKVIENSNVLEAEEIEVEMDNIIEFEEKNKIYLATTSERMRGERDYLYMDLKGKIESEELPYEIIPSPEEVLELNNLDENDYEEKINYYLNQSLYSIHLFDSVEKNNSSLVHKQYKLAQKKCSSTEFKCMISLNSNALDNELINKIETDRLKNPNIVRLTDKSLLEIRAAVFSQIEKNNLIRTKISKLGRSKKSVFILCHKEDLEKELTKNLLNRVIKELEDKHEIVVDEPLLEDNLEAIEHEKKRLNESDGAIVFYGYGNRNWWAQKKSKIVRADHLDCKAVCFENPDKDNKINYVSENIFLHLNRSNSIELDLENFANCLKDYHA